MEQENTVQILEAVLGLSDMIVGFFVCATVGSIFVAGLLWSMSSDVAYLVGRAKWREGYEEGLGEKK